MSIRIRKCMCSNTGSLVLHLIEFKIKSEGTQAEGRGHRDQGRDTQEDNIIQHLTIFLQGRIISTPM